MIYVYCPRRSDGARHLVEAIRMAGGDRAERIAEPRILHAGDVVIPWGEAYRGEVPNGATVLNRDMRIFNKYTELETLARAGVAVPPHALPGRDNRGWLGRMFNHQGGKDLLRPPRQPEFYVQRLQITQEFRVHSFQGRTIRVAMKVPGPGAHHDWVRSHNAGWNLSYGADCQEALTRIRGVRDAAHAAVAALGLDFGAVDIGIVGGRPVVLEVNKAPGLEGGTIAAYARAIMALGRRGLRPENEARQPAVPAQARAEAPAARPQAAPRPPVVDPRDQEIAQLRQNTQQLTRQIEDLQHQIRTIAAQAERNVQAERALRERMTAALAA